MTAKWQNMTKVPQQPAARALAGANAKLATKLSAPASSMPDVVLAELEEKNAPVDILRLMSVILPPRERIWWACLAARDVIGPAPDHNTPSLAAAEEWVFRPSPENRAKAALAVDTAELDDETVKCAQAVVYADGTLGPGELAEHAAPPGAGEVLTFAMNLVALEHHKDDFESYLQLLIDRAVNIAKGGNGKIGAKEG